MLEKLKPYRFSNYQPTFDDIESLTTLELVSKLHDYINNVIDEVNNNSEKVDECYNTLMNNLAETIGTAVRELEENRELDPVILNALNRNLTHVDAIATEIIDCRGNVSTLRNSMNNTFNQIKSNLSSISNQNTSAIRELNRSFDTKVRKLLPLTGGVWRNWKEIRTLKHKKQCVVEEVTDEYITIKCSTGSFYRRLRFNINTAKTVCYTITRLQNYGLDSNSIMGTRSIPTFKSLYIDGKRYMDLSTLCTVGFTFEHLLINFDNACSNGTCVKTLSITSDGFTVCETYPDNAEELSRNQYVEFLDSSYINVLATHSDRKVFVMTDEGVKTFTQRLYKRGNTVTREFDFRSI